jgi:hypothetical protein
MARNCIRTQRGAATGLSRACGTAIWLSVLAFCGLATAFCVLPGCASVYLNATDNLPADPGDRLKLRMRQAIEVARQLDTEIRRAMSSAKDWEARAQRLESLGIELERRAASIGDVIDRMGEPQEGAVEVLAAFQEAAGRSSAAAGSVARHEFEAAGALASAESSVRAAIDRAEEFLATKRAKGSPG